jgi:hypothetical protein
MWSRRSPAEIESLMIEARAKAGRIRFNPLPAFLYALLLATAFLFSRHSGWSGKFTFAIPVAGKLHTIGWPWWFIFWLITIYAVQAISGRRIDIDHNENDTVICPACHIVQGATEEAKCRCAVALEPLRNWRWSKDPTDETAEKT